MAAQKKVLIVEDNEIDIRVLTQVMKRIGVKDLRIELSGEAAYEACVSLLEETPQQDKKVFDLIISDWNMPNGSGLQFLKRIRENLYFRDIPFIMLTGKTDAEEIKKAIDVGVTDYIIKPPQLELIQEKIARHLETLSSSAENKA